MLVTITKEIMPTVSQVADAIWEMSAQEQIDLLAALHTHFCTNNAGEFQLANIANAMDAALDCPKIMLFDSKAFHRATKAKELITKLYEFVKAGDIVKKLCESEEGTDEQRF